MIIFKARKILSFFLFIFEAFQRFENPYPLSFKQSSALSLTTALIYDRDDRECKKFVHFSLSFCFQCVINTVDLITHQLYLRARALFLIQRG